jgi:hypothetical protein
MVCLAPPTKEKFWLRAWVKNPYFSDMTPRHWVIGFRNFERNLCFYLEGVKVRGEWRGTAESHCRSSSPQQQQQQRRGNLKISN